MWPVIVNEVNVQKRANAVHGIPKITGPSDLPEKKRGTGCCAQMTRSPACTSASTCPRSIGSMAESSDRSMRRILLTCSRGFWNDDDALGAGRAIVLTDATAGAAVFFYDDLAVAELDRE